MRNFTIAECEQKTPEWLAIRAGKLTGSVAGDMLAQIKTGEAAARRDLRLQLVCERLTGRPTESGFVSKDMERGNELEAAAVAAYERTTGAFVEASGFLQHTSLMAGCSLDGHVGDFAGIVEVKVPKSATHLGYIRANALPSNHVPQITHNLWISGASWCDFVSFDDRMPEGLQLVIVRVQAADLDLAGYEAKARAFLAEVDRECAELQARIPKVVA